MYNGIINIYKEKGFTSHDVVAKLRGILKQKKIGHTGTLDPDATGVLPVCLGKATKLCDLLTDKQKSYRAEMLLGRETDTQDIWGNTLQQKDVLTLRDSITDEKILDVIHSFEGQYNQIPPMYSAIKINGKRLYELARQGVEVERKPRSIFISSIYNIEINYPYISMDVDCSKGAYIRTLCHDIGQKLGCSACMSSLLRTKSGSFTLDGAYKLSEVEELVNEGVFESKIVPVDAIFAELYKVSVPSALNKYLYNGNSLPMDRLPDFDKIKLQKKIRIYDENNEFIGIYITKDNMLKPEKLFLS